MAGRPRGAIFIVTDECNGLCTMCNYWTVAVPSSLDAAQIKSFSENYLLSTINYVTLSGGEPLLYPDLFDVAEFFRDNGKSTVLSTNGLLLNDHIDRVCRCFDKVIVSLNGHNPAEHQRVFGIDSFDDILSAVRRIHRHFRAPRLIIKMIIQKINYLHLVEFFDLAVSLGIDGVAIGVPDVSTNTFHRHPPSAAERERLLLCPDEARTFHLIVKKLYARYSGLISSGFLVEGNPKLFCDYFDYHAGIRPDLPPHECAVQGGRVIVTPSGCLKYCFFCDPIGTIHDSPNDLQEKVRIGLEFPSLEGKNVICQSCYQFLDWSF